MSIQRYTVSTSLHSDPDDEGAFVRYADHVAAVQKAYRDGHNDHARTVQHWADTHGAYRQHDPEVCKCEGETP